MVEPHDPHDPEYALRYAMWAMSVSFQKQKQLEQQNTKLRNKIINIQEDYEKHIPSCCYYCGECFHSRGKLFKHMEWNAHKL